MGGKEQTLEDFAARIGRSVRAVFGDTVDVKAIDLSSSEASEHRDILDFVQRYNPTLPIIAVNGTIRFDGQVQPLSIIEVLRSEMSA